MSFSSWVEELFRTRGWTLLPMRDEVAGIETAFAVVMQDHGEDAPKRSPFQLDEVGTLPHTQHIKTVPSTMNITVAFP